MHFPTLPKLIKKTKATNIDEVYKLIGTTNQSVSYWRNNPTKTSTLNKNKYDVILKAGELFGLDLCEQELLANKAGLSLQPCHKKTGFNLESGDEYFPYPEKPEQHLGFTEHFEMVLSSYKGTILQLSEMALISDRHLRYIRDGTSLRKEPVLAVLVVLGLGLNEIQTILKKAGYLLSKSLPNDAVTIWLLENEREKISGNQRILYINETLDFLGMPLLMTRDTCYKKTNDM